MKKGIKHQRAHKNKYDKRSITEIGEADFRHFSQRSKNYYGTVPGTKRKKK